VPVLMLGGARDEVVPRSQMQELWAIIRNRGRDVEGNKKRRASGAQGAASGAPEKARAEGEAQEVDEPEPNDPKAPPRVFTDAGNTYIEFGAGMHNDTCVQPGYWSAVAEFVASLRAKVISSSS